MKIKCVWQKYVDHNSKTDYKDLALLGRFELMYLTEDDEWGTLASSKWYILSDLDSQSYTYFHWTEHSWTYNEGKDKVQYEGDVINI